MNILIQGTQYGVSQALSYLLQVGYHATTMKRPKAERYKA